MIVFSIIFLIVVLFQSIEKFKNPHDECSLFWNRIIINAAALKQLQEVARLGGNVFEELMETVKVASLGQITDALFNVGGQYRRNM